MAPKAKSRLHSHEREALRAAMNGGTGAVASVAIAAIHASHQASLNMFAAQQTSASTTSNILTAMLAQIAAPQQQLLMPFDSDGDDEEEGEEELEQPVPLLPITYPGCRPKSLPALPPVGCRAEAGGDESVEPGTPEGSPERQPPQPRVQPQQRVPPVRGRAAHAYDGSRSPSRTPKLIRSAPPIKPRSNVVDDESEPEQEPPTPTNNTNRYQRSTCSIARDLYRNQPGT